MARSIRISTRANVWAGRRVMQARQIVAGWIGTQGTPCGKCGELVTLSDTWVVGHKIERAIRPDLMFDPTNWQAEHKDCSDKSGHVAKISKKNLTKKNSASRFSPSASGTEAPALLSIHTQSKNSPMKIREELTWSEFCKVAPTWCKPLLSVPGDAAPPLAMTPPHPEAVGTYGWDAIAWVKKELKIELRWWQKLAFVRQLEYRADGSLVWRTILESGPRRIGKSVRLRSMALWRIDNSALFGETQLALHTGKDIPIVREIHKQAWKWAQLRKGWNVRKGVGQEEVNKDEVHRWLVRSTDGVYGYDVCLGMIDESWAVPASVFDEGLEPATMERKSPQNLLTSTAHRRATNLMRKKLGAALSAEDGETLLMLWGALISDDPGDPQTWKNASPHWSKDREKMLSAKYQAALAGQADPELDDSDPMAGFVSQYLNVWRLHEKAKVTGNEITTEEEWEKLAEDAPTTPPDSVAVESWFSDGCSVALSWVLPDGRALVQVSDHPDLESAAEAIPDGFKGRLVAGASLIEEPELKPFRPVAGQGRVVATVQELSRLMTDGKFAHDGGKHLTDQVLSVRTQPTSDGPRLVSKSRADGIKAAVWAVNSARTKKKTGKLQLVLPD